MFRKSYWVVLMWVLAAPACLGQEFTLPSGDKVEVFDIASGNRIHLDGRSLYERSRQKLPAALRAMVPAQSNIDEQSQMFIEGIDTVALAWMYTQKKSAGPPSKRGITFVLSDGSGWYSLGSMEFIFGARFGISYPFVPRTVKELSLHLYQEVGGGLRLVGTQKIRNPRFDASLMKTVTTSVPRAVTSGSLTVNIERFYAGLRLKDISRKGVFWGMSEKAEQPTSTVEALMAGKRVRAKMPEEAFTAIVLRPTVDGDAWSSVTQAKLRVVDVAGSEYNCSLELYRAGGTYVGIMPGDLVRADGNYKLELQLTEKWSGGAPVERKVGFEGVPEWP